MVEFVYVKIYEKCSDCDGTGERIIPASAEDNDHEPDTKPCKYCGEEGFVWAYASGDKGFAKAKVME